MVGNPAKLPDAISRQYEGYRSDVPQGKGWGMGHSKIRLMDYRRKEFGPVYLKYMEAV